MIERIRRRFVWITLAVLALAMAMVVAIVNAANWFNVRAELGETMSALLESASEGGRGADFPGGKGGKGARGGDRDGQKGGFSRHMRNAMNEARYFTVVVDADGEVTLNDAMRLSEESSEQLLELARQALAKGRDSGLYGDYLYRIEPRDEGSLGLFLNCETRLTGVRRLALISALACAGCTLLAWLLASRFSSRAIRPMAENAARQKQFITDAGHELKTPLTVISANMDVLALEQGDSEWIRSTRKQVANMRDLVGELIYLSRLDEEDARLNREEFDLSGAVREVAEPFAGMAEFSGKALAMDVEDGVRLTGDPAAIRRLVSILCDNAVKYAPEGDTVRLALRRSRGAVVLSVENGLEKPMDEETLGRLFDRFYRADASRSRESGGYGIGLSIARAIAERHGGDIRADQTDEGRLRFTCRLKA